MDLTQPLLFTVYPYMCLTIFVIGHAYRYVTDRYGWNARSSEFLEKRSLYYGSILFHWGVIGTFLGHAGGLLIPQRLFDLVGFRPPLHLLVAYWTGLLVGAAAFVGAVLLVWRRVSHRRVRAAGTLNDTLTIGGLMLVIGAGLYNVLFGHYNVLYTVAPWIRGIVTFTPDPALMRSVPLSYQIHVLAALGLLAFSPFSRLVHIWSAPLFYFFRRWILFRRHPAAALQPSGPNTAGAGGKEV
jgi:nitrate reductase gamma subunit